MPVLAQGSHSGSHPVNPGRAGLITEATASWEGAAPGPRGLREGATVGDDSFLGRETSRLGCGWAWRPRRAANCGVGGHPLSSLRPALWPKDPDNLHPEPGEGRLEATRQVLGVWGACTSLYFLPQAHLPSTISYSCL